MEVDQLVLEGREMFEVLVGEGSTRRRPASTGFSLALAGLAGDDAWLLVNRLGDAERRAIVLAYFGGHSYRNVAGLLGLPEGTVKSRIRTGLVRLRSELSITSGGGV